MKKWEELTEAEQLAEIKHNHEQQAINPAFMPDRVRGLIDQLKPRISEGYEIVERILLYCNSLNRFRVFLEISDILTPDDLAKAFIFTYTSCDNLYQYKKDIKDCLIKCRMNKHLLMSGEDLASFRKLPSELVLFRGMTMNEYKSKDFGVSWTIDKNIARFFAKDYNRNISTASTQTAVGLTVIEKDSCMCLINDRGENEIIIHPHVIDELEVSILHI